MGVRDPRGHVDGIVAGADPRHHLHVPGSIEFRLAAVGPESSCRNQAISSSNPESSLTRARSNSAAISARSPFTPEKSSLRMPKPENHRLR